MAKVYTVLLGLLLGPALGTVVLLASRALFDYGGAVCLGVLAWMVAWWITQPVPWGITAILPVLLFPLAGVMDIVSIMAMYGQTVLLWIVGLVSLGYALEKYGVARRIARRLVASRMFGGSIQRFLLGYMLTTGLISMFVSDAATIGLMLPVGISVVDYMDSENSGEGPRDIANQKYRLRTSIALSTLYSAIAGGIATPAGVPHNAVIMTYLGKFQSQISFLDWVSIGIPFFLCALALFYLAIYLLILPRGWKLGAWLSTVDTGNSSRPARLSQAEKNVIFTFLVMVVLFLLPGIAGVVCGSQSQVAVKLQSVLPIWIVPVIVLFLLFLLPIDVSKGKFTLEWNDFLNHGGWNVALLATGGVVLGNSLVKFRVIDTIFQLFPWEQMPTFILLCVSLGALLILTNFMSGTAAVSVMCPLIMPIILARGYDPSLLAVSLASFGLGFWLPWAGAASGTAFATGNIPMKEMIKVGGLASFALLLVIIGLNFLWTSWG